MKDVKLYEAVRNTLIIAVIISHWRTNKLVHYSRLLSKELHAQTSFLTTANGKDN